jgi:hypothetical protein
VSIFGVMEHRFVEISQDVLSRHGSWKVPCIVLSFTIKELFLVTISSSSDVLECVGLEESVQLPV